jgi:hypothetical protein
MAASFTSIPYVSHMSTPSISNNNMVSDKSFADFVFHICITCGKNVIDVIVPAAKPSICMEVIFLLVSSLKVTGVGLCLFVEYCLK